MKILIITPYFAPAWAYGGPPKINYDIAIELVSRGIYVEVWTTDALDEHSNPNKLEALNGIIVRRFPNFSNYLAWKHKIFLPFSLGRYASSHIKPFDFVFITDLRDYLNPVISSLCIKNQIPYSISAYGQIPYDFSPKSILKKIYDYIYGCKVTRNAKFLFGQTDNEIRMYQKYYKSKNKQLKILPLAVNYKDYINLPTKTSFRKKYNIDNSDKVILFVGRINYLKGIDITVDILSKITKIIKNTKFVIVGRDDNYLAKLKDIISKHKLSNHIIFTGPLYGTNNYSAYIESDLFVFTPRFAEETSMAALASLSLGTPVVTVKESQIPYLEDYQAGIEIDPSKKNSYQEIIRLLCNNKLLKNMKKNSVRLIREKYDIPKIVDLLLNYIKYDQQ